MIEKLYKGSEYLEILEGYFPEVFTIEQVNHDLENNVFTNYVVYQLNYNPVAFINYYIMYERAEIININVLDTFQNQGIATKLMEYMVEDCRKNGVTSITLEVKCTNQKAIHLYQGFGFQKVGIRKGYYQGIDALLMEKELMDVEDVYILGVETSCDETSVSIVKNGCEEIATVVLTQIDIHKDFGGVVPEIASRHHVKNITMVMEECLEKANMEMKDITAIAVTYGPGLVGSLLVGVEAAKTLAYVNQKPLIPVNHMSGHIYANNLVEPLQFPLIALVVSGGHTELIYMKDHYEFQKLGGTLDDAVGECYDKVARILEVPYPGGPTIDKWSLEGKDTYLLPLPKNDSSYDFSFSGLKSAVINLVHNEEQRGNPIRKKDVAASFQNTAIEILTKKTMRAIRDYQVKHFIIAGGVAANKVLREKLTELCKTEDVHITVPAMKYCTDNAAMIAASGYYAYLRGDRADFTLNPHPSLELGKNN